MLPTLGTLKYGRVSRRDAVRTIGPQLAKKADKVVINSSALPETSVDRMDHPM